jgi:RNA polymerase sigma-70 factor (ECF subfamily)
MTKPMRRNRANAGDSAASAAISRMEACVPALRRYARVLLKGGHDQDSDDLVHDSLALALDRLHTQRRELPIRPWLFTIMHNLFVSGVRRQQSRGEPVSLDSVGEGYLAVGATQEDSLRWRDLLRGLESLPEEQRLVVILVSVEDLSYAEVGQVLGIPIGTVMSRLSRGRERLRLTMEGGERPALQIAK